MNMMDTPEGKRFVAYGQIYDQAVEDKQQEILDSMPPAQPEPGSPQNMSPSARAEKGMAARKVKYGEAAMTPSGYQQAKSQPPRNTRNQK